MRIVSVILSTVSAGAFLASLWLASRASGLASPEGVAAVAVGLASLCSSTVAIPLWADILTRPAKNTTGPTPYDWRLCSPSRADVLRANDRPGADAVYLIKNWPVSVIQEESHD